VTRDQEEHDAFCEEEHACWHAGNRTYHSPFQEALIEHWDGTSWSVVKSPTVGWSDTFGAVTSVPGTSQLWTVGFSFYKSGAMHTLTEFYC